ncbi:conserved hypothetical protein [Exiguobacterium sp. 8H]|uniref:hypothetical protein n=1 Tax=Exiguobacterium sp. 8H TaxID=2653140 RepID=UPI0012F341D4|nr:hypothetical protein [Exiguobacterium sp. 8H]VXB38519.1 conserved hypothetical protein [Exiguobacterium sp. 8H]
MFASIEGTYPCFRRPHRIGDVLHVDGTPALVLGIEQIWFDYRPSRVIVQYTVQHLDVPVPKSHMFPVFPTDRGLFELGARVKGNRLLERTDPWSRKDRPLEHYRPGNVVDFKGRSYKIVEYTDIDLDGTDYIVRFSVRPIRPIRPEEARAKWLEERKARVGLHVLPHPDEDEHE